MQLPELLCDTPLADQCQALALCTPVGSGPGAHPSPMQGSYPSPTAGSRPPSPGAVGATAAAAVSRQPSPGAGTAQGAEEGAGGVGSGAAVRGEAVGGAATAGTGTGATVAPPHLLSGELLAEVVRLLTRLSLLTALLMNPPRASPAAGPTAGAYAAPATLPAAVGLAVGAGGAQREAEVVDVQVVRECLGSIARLLRFHPHLMPVFLQDDRCVFVCVFTLGM